MLMLHDVPIPPSFIHHGAGWFIDYLLSLIFVQSSVLITTRHAKKKLTATVESTHRTSASVALTFSWKAAIAWLTNPSNKKTTIKMGHSVIVEMKNVWFDGALPIDLLLEICSVQKDIIYSTLLLHPGIKFCTKL